MVAARGAPGASTSLLPHDSSSVAVARRTLTADLRRRGVSETTIDDAVLVISELVTNALRHGRPLTADVIRVDWSMKDLQLLELSVTDGGGPTAPVKAQPSISARGGRGLAIVSSLSHSWGVRRRPEETTVWAVLALKAASGSALSPTPQSDLSVLPPDGADGRRGRPRAS